MDFDIWRLSVQPSATSAAGGGGHLKVQDKVLVDGPITCTGGGGGLHLNSSSGTTSGGKSVVTGSAEKVVESVENEAGGLAAGNSIPMEFITVLIHQHAKTLVALQDLQREVLDLKSVSIIQNSSKPSSTFKHSSSIARRLPTLPPPLPNLRSAEPPLGVPGCSCYWQQTQKPSDSGFTETKSSSQNKTDDSESSDGGPTSSADELYSLLSLIEFKVVAQQHQNHHHHHVGELRGPRRPRDRVLGVLDEKLGNSQFDFVKFKLLDKRVIAEVLNCHDKVELRRQLLFTLARLSERPGGDKAVGATNEKPRGVNVIEESSATRSLLRALEALKSENEQLRQKLQEMEIEVEGTQCKLRILSRNCNKSSGGNHHPVGNGTGNGGNSSSRLQESSSIPVSLVRVGRLKNVDSEANVGVSEMSDKKLVLNKSLSSIGSLHRSFIPVPVARVKKKSGAANVVVSVAKIKNVNLSNNNSNFWNQWFG